MTVTNWMSGLAASALGLGLRRALRISVVVLLLAAGLSIVQRGLFPHAGMPFDVQEEAAYVVLAPDYILHRLYTSVAEPFLAPTPVEPVDGSGAHLVNFGTPGGTPFFWLAATGWLVLAGLAVEALRKGVVSPHIAVFALFVLDGEFVLHILYGDGFFLYALNFVPLLVLLASTACVGRRRRLALAVAIATALLSGAHNLAQLDRATDLLNHPPGATGPAPIAPAAAAFSIRGSLLVDGAICAGPANFQTWRCGAALPCSASGGST